MSIPVGYHFRVDFVQQKVTNPIDVRFQEVSGLSTSLQTSPIKEGVHQVQLAREVEHDNLILRRGMATGSLIGAQFNIAMSSLKFLPQTVMVTLLDNQSLPRACWWFLEACPKKWSVSDFNADANSLVIETLEFSYKRLQVVKI